MSLAEAASSSTRNQQPAGTLLISGGTSRMESDRHYPEEAPVHRVTFDVAAATSSDRIIGDQPARQE